MANVTVNTITNNLRFTGQYHDQETGLHYNYFRDYDPTTGQYIQSDPIGLDGGLNTYLYVLNNPNSAIDPLGLRFTPSEFGGSWRDLFLNPVNHDRRSECSQQCLASIIGPVEMVSAAGATPIPKGLMNVPVVGKASQVTNAVSAFGLKAAPNNKMPGGRALGSNRTFGVLGRANLLLFGGLVAVDSITLMGCVEQCMDGEKCDTKK